jgi:ABC-type arginine transport system permease subunit
MDVRESDTAVRTKPDLMMILLAVFGVGVLVTLLLPMAASDSVAAPASELQAGVIIGN